MSLGNAIVIHIKKVLSSRAVLPAAAVIGRQLTLQHLRAFLDGGGQVPVENGAAGDLDGVAGAGAVIGEGAHIAGGGVNSGVAVNSVGVSAEGGLRAEGCGGRAGPPAGAGAQVSGARAARAPAATARRHLRERSGNESADPRCLWPGIKALGGTVYRDILSFIIAVKIDPAVNALKPRHGTGLSKLADMLRLVDGLSRL